MAADRKGKGNEGRNCEMGELTETFVTVNGVEDPPTAVAVLGVPPQANAAE